MAAGITATAVDLRPAPRLGVTNVSRGAAVLVAMVLGVGLSGCVILGDRALNEPIPAVLGIEIELPDRVETTYELVLSDADVEAMGPPSSTVADRYGVILLRTSYTRTDDVDYEHCLVEPATITQVSSGEEVASLPAGTCLSTHEFFDVRLD